MTENQLTIVISATFTAEPLEASLAFWLATLEIPATIEFAPYHQVIQQLLDSNSLFFKNQAGLNVILMRMMDWLNATQPFSTEFVDLNEINKSAQQFIEAIKIATTHSKVPYLICWCPAIHELFSVQTAIIAELRDLPNIYCLTTTELNEYYPVSNYSDIHSETLGHIPYTPLFFTALGTHIIRKWFVLQNPPYKVIVLDCDETLWQGVCGEEGVWGIKIDTHHQFLQEFMVRQYHAGMLIALCSKNQEEDIIAVFAQRTDMQLKREHIVSWRINWQAKSENIRSLATELQLGLESFIFIDDNPVECAEVKTHCPQVFVLQLPEDKSKIRSFLNHLWVFDHLRVTTTDQQRTRFYQEAVQRTHLQQNTLTLAHFLASLQLKVTISPIHSQEIPRISQILPLFAVPKEK
ncbi:MAG: hypothetical protein BWK79_13620 [Beggiatoa sp. IS2]|nr:MAG: hypothetical protein BWK79_13620 [Beggiatoa sp. IS2]